MQRLRASSNPAVAQAAASSNLAMKQHTDLVAIQDKLRADNKAEEGAISVLRKMSFAELEKHLRAQGTDPSQVNISLAREGGVDLLFKRMKTNIEMAKKQIGRQQYDAPARNREGALYHPGESGHMHGQGPEGRA